MEYPPFTRNDADHILDMFTRMIDSSEIDVNVLDIVWEGAEDFFNGRNTAGETARIIQSRVSIYISEQFG